MAWSASEKTHAVIQGRGRRDCGYTVMGEGGLRSALRKTRKEEVGDSETRCLRNYTYPAGSTTHRRSTNRSEKRRRVWEEERSCPLVDVCLTFLRIGVNPCFLLVFLFCFFCFLWSKSLFFVCFFLFSADFLYPLFFVLKFHE